MKATRALFHAALGVAACLVNACGSRDDASSAQTCFPVPSAGAVRSTGIGGHQGTTLQGYDIEPQGTTLQGYDLQPQGTTLQGYDLQPQGTTLQGYDLEPQGTTQQGRRAASSRADEEPNGPSFRLEDMNGVWLDVAVTNAPVSLVDGKLVADGFADMAALQGTTLLATLPNGEHFAVDVLTVEAREGIEWVAIAIDGAAACAPGEHGVFVAGAWDASGRHTELPGTLTYSCGSGVIAKCASWGYAPWNVGAARHTACTRLARADYCGDGNSWTMEGTKIGMRDSFGVQGFVAHDGYSFEAAWGAEGALCVNHTRYDVQDLEGNIVSPSCLAALPSCSDFREAQAIAAELTNYSAPALVSTCE